MKLRRVYHCPVDPAMFSAENVLKSMDSDREALVKNWGQDEFDRRYTLIKKYIEKKNERNR